MLKGVVWLLGFQAIGEFASFALQLPISGAVGGMGLLLGWLAWRGQAPDELNRVADGLLANMPILFVPVGAGAMVYIDLFQRHWLAVAVGVVAGTFVTLAISATAAAFLMRLRSRPAREGHDALARRNRVYGRS